MKYTFSKGHKKFGGRKKGTPNKNKELAEKILTYVCGRDIDEDLQELYNKHLPKYWDLVAKFLPKPPQEENNEDRELNIVIKGYKENKKDEN